MNIKNINFSFVFQLVAILSLTIIYIFQWGVMITTPSLRTGTDFMAFYSAGRVAQEYGIENAYKIPLQQEVQKGVLGFEVFPEQVLIYIHVPYLILLLELIVNKSYISSFLFWVFIMLVLQIIASNFLIKKLLAVSLKNHYETFFSIVLFFPFFQSLILGQNSAILFLGFLIWSYGILNKKDWSIAIGLGITTIRPHLCIAILIPTLIVSEKKNWWKILLPSAFLTLLSVLLLGMNGTVEYLQILQVSALGSGYGTNESGMVNFIGLISRIFTNIDTNLIRSIGWLGFLAGIIFVVVLWFRTKTYSLELIGITIIVILFFAPHLHYHDLTLMLIPLAIAIRKNENSSKLFLGVSLILLVFRSFYYFLPYVLYGGLAWRLWKSKNQ